jgi:phosphoenolpyruvate carboxykinase (ATP)
MKQTNKRYPQNKSDVSHPFHHSLQRFIKVSSIKSILRRQDMTMDLFKIALKNEEGVLASNGALRVLTGARTGRSPKDKYIVCDAITQTTVDWGSVNQPLKPEIFEKLWQEAVRSLESYPVYEGSFQVGAHPQHHTTVRVRCNLAWHTLFCQKLFLTPETPLVSPEWQLVNAAHFIPDPARYELNGPAAIVLDFSGRRLLICGTQYAGEMKKGMFSALNFLLPDQDVLPMHCAANKGKDGTTSLFFGLSGTGKTTLSADPNRLLIGDDEHGWASDGLFNFEGGCYAKCIRLSQSGEPLIWAAIKNGSVMENVVLDSQGNPDYDDASITENTRVVYPLDYIPEHVPGLVHPHPQSVVFLSCDLFGVLPPVAKLAPSQVIDYFLAGYTALVGSTEFGSGTGIKTTFSPCFGAPFFSRPPQVYADMLIKRLAQTKADVFLVNTGWSGGSYGQGGERFSLALTRRVISAITNGELRDVPYDPLDPLGLAIPKKIEGIPGDILNPRLAWKQAGYDEAAQKLVGLFAERQNQRSKKG